MLDEGLKEKIEKFKLNKIEKEFEINDVVVNRNTNLIYTITSIIPTTDSQVYEGKLLGTSEISLLYPEDIEIYIFNKPKAISGVTRIGEFEYKGGSIRFKHNKGVTTDASPILAFADVLYSEVAGRKVKVTISIEEIEG